jgi:hypothetical protein
VVDRCFSLNLSQTYRSMRKIKHFTFFFFHHAGSADFQLCSAAFTLDGKNPPTLNTFSYQVWWMTLVWKTSSAGSLVQYQNFSLTNAVYPLNCAICDFSSFTLCGILFPPKI